MTVDGSEAEVLLQPSKFYRIGPGCQSYIKLAVSLMLLYDKLECLSSATYLRLGT